MASRLPILLLCAALAVNAQTTRRPRPAAGPGPAKASPAMQAWPVGKLDVEGNKLYTDEQILAVAGLKVGQTAGKAEFDAAQARLLATGAFESVGYKFDPIPGAKANGGVFHVDEITQLFPYRFEELRVDEAALREHLRSKDPLFKDRVPGTQATLDRLVREVRTFTKMEDVTAKLEGTGDLVIVFRPSSLPSVAEITFKGNSAIPTTKLQQIVSGAGVGAVFTENRFRQILDASVRPAYEALGYLGVQFPSFDVTPAKDVKGVAVTVNVKEGEVYKLSAVEIKGELAENSKELVKIGGFEVDGTANFEKIRAGVDEIRKALRRKGHIEASTSLDRKLDAEKKTVAVMVNVEPGPQFTMGKLTIEGLDIETEPHIRKLWTLKRGQPFNIEYPDYFLAQLVEGQVMDNLGRTRSTVTPNPDRQTVDVTLTLEAEKRAKKPEKP